MLFDAVVGPVQYIQSTNYFCILHTSKIAVVFVFVYSVTYAFFL